MNIKSLRTLVMLAEHNCDFGIHRQLGIPRSTLWAHINEIEKETGIKCIIRKKQNNLFTEEGRNFLPYAQRIVNAFDEGLSKKESTDPEKPAGELIIATTTSIAASWLMCGIRSFKKDYPNIQLKIIADDYISTTTERMADILFRPLEEKDFLTRHWHVTYHFGLWAHPTYIQEYGKPKTPADMVNHHVLGYGEHIFSYFSDIDWHLKGRWGNLPRLYPDLTINSTKSLYLAAQQGLGICSAAQQSNLFYAGNLERILPEIDGPSISVYFCSKEEMSPKLEKNVNIFNDFFADYLQSIGVVLAND